VHVVDIGVSMERTGPFGTNVIPPFEFGLRDLDMALTFRNMHNFTPEGRANVNAAVFKALKSGGLYGIVDHSRRHMEPMTNENRRRADVVQIIKEVLEAGFEFVDYSDIHFRPDDELRFEVGRKTVTGNTDRFTLLFRKP
jgi:predicted methyltransferase